MASTKPTTNEDEEIGFVSIEKEDSVPPSAATAQPAVVEQPPPEEPVLVSAADANGSDDVDAYHLHDGPESIGRTNHICCGCCCDVRTAVIVVDIISLSLAALAVLGLAALVTQAGSVSDQYEADDRAIDEFLGDLDAQTIGVSIFFGVLAMGVYGLGIFGAVTFRQWPLYGTAIWYSLGIIESLLALDILSLLLRVFFLYPHIMLIIELRNGTLTPANFAKRKKCCCATK